MEEMGKYFVESARAKRAWLCLMMILLFASINCYATQQKFDTSQHDTSKQSHDQANQDI
jgi:hypothetical protein